MRMRTHTDRRAGKQTGGWTEAGRQAKKKGSNQASRPQQETHTQINHNKRTNSRTRQKKKKQKQKNKKARGKTNNVCACTHVNKHRYCISGRPPRPPAKNKQKKQNTKQYKTTKKQKTKGKNKQCMHICTRTHTDRRAGKQAATRNTQQKNKP